MNLKEIWIEFPKQAWKEHSKLEKEDNNFVFVLVHPIYLLFLLSVILYGCFTFSIMFAIKKVI